MSNNDKSIEFTNEELHLFRQWFESVQDCNSQYLEEKDYILAKRLYEVLGWRVPHDILRKIESEKQAGTEEAVISINGEVCSGGQAMAIRVALEHFDSNLKSDGLGNDEHGLAMSKEYQTRIDEIRDFLHKK